MNETHPEQAIRRLGSASPHRRLTACDACPDVTARHRPHPHIGDRLERAIEERVELTGEFEAIASPEEDASRRRRLMQTGIWLFVTGISLYLVAPSLLDTLGSWRDVQRFEWQWLMAMLVLQGCSLGCLWFLQQLALRPVPIAPVITSQLAGNALAKIAPGGGALGAALQYRMLVQAGVGREKAVGGLTVVNLFTFAMVLALPVLTIPTLIRGGVDENLIEVAALGIGVFAVLAIVGSIMLAGDEAADLGRPDDPAGPQPHAQERAAAERPAGAAAARARPHPRDLRPALEAGAGGDRRPLGVRLPDAAGGAGGRQRLPQPRPRAARLLRRAGARADPADAGRPRLRRGRADRHADARGRLGRQRGAGDLRLPPLLLLAAAAARARRRRRAPAGHRADGSIRSIIAVAVSRSSGRLTLKNASSSSSASSHGGSAATTRVSEPGPSSSSAFVSGASACGS